MRVHKHKRGVNYVVKFSQVSRNRLRPYSNNLFVTRPEAKIQQKEAKEIMDMRFLRRSTSSSTEVKNHDLLPIEFSHTSLYGLKYVTK